MFGFRHKTEGDPPSDLVLLWDRSPKLDSHILLFQTVAEFSGSRINGCRHLEK